ncbi:retroviral-like aspartic protease family protein [Sphingosinicella sp. BN140058]|uniref:retroviral-like aspartic protease family protein n=1 Tax=Sphingosinicella sp. BN140058 TaxID=1892855 RepID=UPI001013109E|nr:retroviral-like aspartic protease family protein [Sphingosinicella sp. BN140058]QAY75836.1 hypothetical protein ETR14_04285 [Sphingosinicella sp. BN140058]
MTRIGRHCSLAACGFLGALALAQADARASDAPPAGTNPVSGALEILPSGHAVVQVRLGDSAPKRFVLDTAASITAIMPRLRAEMPGLAAKAADRPLNGAAGQTQVELASIDRVQVGGYRFGERQMLLMPPGPTDGLGTDGILGADIIADYVVAMDLPGRSWRMAAKVESGMLDGLTTSIPFVLDDQRAPRLTVRINGVAMPAVLDTGARGTIINWAAAHAIGLTPESPGLVRASDIKGATAHAAASVEAPLRELAIGDARATSPKVRIADLSVFKVLGFAGDQPAVILGIDMFADRRFVIDHPSLRLHISPPLVTAAAPHA